MTVTTNSGRMVAHLDGLLPMKLQGTLIAWSCEITWQAKTIVSTILVPMFMKLGRMVTYLDGLLTKLPPWSWKVMRQTKTVTSLLAECLWPPNLVEWWHTLRDYNNKVILRFYHMILQSHVTNKNHYISTASELDRQVTYFDILLTIKWFYVLITWSCNGTWQEKVIIYPQLECLWLQTWQNDNLPWWEPSFIATSSFDQVVLQDHVTN